MKRILAGLQESWGYGPKPVAAANAIAEWIVARLAPKTVVDIGCGGGALVYALRRLGVDARGYDLVPAGVHLHAVDLTSRDYQIPRADVVTCLEVVEHLDDASGRRLVDKIATSDCDVVIFGGGIPMQGGWKHRNEQWQSYWADQFFAWDMLACDDLRQFLWCNDKVAPWYAQDVLVYADADTISDYELTQAEIIDVVHPRTWERIGPMGIYQRLCRAARSFSSLRQASSASSSSPTPSGSSK